MSILFTVIVMAFVVAVLAAVAFAFFEATPFARRDNEFRDPRTGKRFAGRVRTLTERRLRRRPTPGAF